MVERYVGLMSGTSQDAVDGVLAAFSPTHPPQLIASHSAALPAALRRDLDALQAPGGGDLDLALRLHHELALRFADCAVELLAAAGLDRNDVRAIGSHGQTVRHQPNNPAPHSLQLGNAALIAARTGIATVADFRSGDIAAGGQGAPLVPAFHKAVFGDRPGRAVLNLGGIANVSVPDLAGLRPWGWDLGPANTLLDAWARRHLGQPYDADGEFAAAGTVARRLLGDLLSHPFLARPAPKSTGREDFNLPWLDSVLAGHGPLPPADVQATLAEFTAACVELGLTGLTMINELLVCGGGVRNGDLMRRIAARLPGMRVASTASAGIDPQWVEALAFAWLARQRMHEQALDLSTVTGATRPVLLGCVYLP